MVANLETKVSIVVGRENQDQRKGGEWLLLATEQALDPLNHPMHPSPLLLPPLPTRPGLLILDVPHEIKECLWATKQRGRRAGT